MMSVILDVVYVTSFHNPLARECHMAKPELNVMGFVFAQRKRSCGGGPVLGITIQYILERNALNLSSKSLLETLYLMDKI